MRRGIAYVRPALLSMALVVALGVPAAAHAEWFTPEQPICVAPARQTAPAISGTKAVYEDYRNGNFDLYLYDLATSTEKRLTTGTADQRFPQIDGNRVVWADFRNGNPDIYCYDLAANTAKRLTTNTASQNAPDISGTKVVYQDNRNGSSDIYLYDLATNTEKRLTTRTGDQQYPSISGTKVVYEDTGPTGETLHPYIYVYDISTRTDTKIGTWGEKPVISGSTVAWKQITFAAGNPYWVVYHDLVTHEEGHLATYTVNPALSGTNLVYADPSSGFMKVYHRDLSTGVERVVSHALDAQESPAVSGGRIVWTDYRNGYSNTDIYSARINVPTLKTSAPSAVNYNAAATVTGTLKSLSGTGRVGETVTLQMSSNRVTWSSVESTTTTAGGAFALHSPRLTVRRYFRVRYAGAADDPPATSPTMTVKTRIRFTTAPNVSTSNWSYGSTHKVWGYFVPRHTTRSNQIKLRVYRREKQTNGTYRYVFKRAYSTAVTNPTTTLSSKYNVDVKLPNKGTWKLVAYHDDDTANAETWSSGCYVTMR